MGCDEHQRGILNFEPASLATEDFTGCDDQDVGSPGVPQTVEPFGSDTSILFMGFVTRFRVHHARWRTSTKMDPFCAQPDYTPRYWKQVEQMTDSRRGWRYRP